MKHKNLLRSAVLTGLGLLALNANQALASDAKCEIDRPVMFADLNWDSAMFHNAVAKFIIEKGYGCKTDGMIGDNIPMINAVAKGDVDVIMEIWTNNVDEAWKKAESKGQVQLVGDNFEGNEAWWIPKYLVEGDNAPAKGLKSVTDLPKYKDLFKDPEEPTKGRFLNCPAGWTCEMVNGKKLKAYGLEDSFVNFLSGTGAALDSAIISALKRKKPVVFYYWAPTSLIGKYSDQLVQLEEPEYNKEIFDKLKAEDNPSQATAFPKSKVDIGANVEFLKAAPQLAKFLDNYVTSSVQVSQALSYKEDNEASMKEAAVNFLKNNDAWAEWVPADVAKRVKDAL
ncbi:MAG: ABC transporter substrate-binding protein [Gammaproteobacteria bacterium]|nr:ABC transporter substrate-binding protein [Gammaproteobacteria bacterium]